MRLDPDRARTPAKPFEPGALVLCESTRINLDPLDRLLERAAPFKVNDQLFVPNRLA